MGELFSTPKPEAPVPVAAPQMSEHDKAVMQLKVARDKLHKYQKKVEKDRAQYIAKTKELVKSGQKERAMIMLRMKKYKEKQISSLEGQLDNINNMLSSIETAEMTNKVMTALEVGNSALKRLNDEMPIEKVQQIMDDSAEAIAYQQEVSHLLSQSISPEDEVDIDAELLELQAEIGGVPDLPEAPKSKVHIPDDEVQPVKQPTLA